MKLSEITNASYEEMLENGLYHNDYISHGWAKNAAAKSHKYIERWRGKNGKWYYRYKSKAQEGLAKIARGRWKTADGKSLSSETITRNARKPGLQLSKKDYGKAGYNPWSSGLRPTGKTYRLNKRNLDAGTKAGRKRTKYYTSKNISNRTKNVSDKGYSSSKDKKSGGKGVSALSRGQGYADTSYNYKNRYNKKMYDKSGKNKATVDYEVSFNNYFNNKAKSYMKNQNSNWNKKKKKK